MGYRAHVCTTYRVQYGTGCFSAGACDAVNRLLENYEYPDGDGGRKSLVEYCDAEETVMELSREGLGSLVASLENGDAPEETDAVLDAGYTREDLISVFREWLDSSDKSKRLHKDRVVLKQQMLWDIIRNTYSPSRKGRKNSIGA